MIQPSYPARIYRNALHTSPGLVKYNSDWALFQWLQSEYQQEKNKSLTLAQQSINNSLFIISVGLFSFGEIDVYEDILDNIPNSRAPYRGLGGVLKRLLPVPRYFSCLEKPDLTREWIRKKYPQLRWSESLGKYVLQNYRILSSLPASSNPIYFTTENPGNGDDLIVEILSDTGNKWLGCFPPGLSNFSGVYQHPNRVDLMIISHGQGYIVNPETQQLLETFGLQIIDALEFCDVYAILFREIKGFISYDETGLLWQKYQLPRAGIRQLESHYYILMGECQLSSVLAWQPFWMDIRTGEIHFGNYKTELNSYKIDKRWWKFW